MWQHDRVCGRQADPEREADFSRAMVATDDTFGALHRQAEHVPNVTGGGMLPR